MQTIATYTLKQPIPVLSVRDVQEAVDFFGQKLGFSDPWVHNGEYGGVSKDGQQIHFAKSETPGKGMIYNFVDNVDEIYHSVQSAGVEIIADLKDQFYGMRDFTLRDPSGNAIAFAAQIQGSNQ